MILNIVLVILNYLQNSSAIVFIRSLNNKSPIIKYTINSVPFSHTIIPYLWFLWQPISPGNPRKTNFKKLTEKFENSTLVKKAVDYQRPNNTFTSLIFINVQVSTSFSLFILSSLAFWSFILLIISFAGLKTPNVCPAHTKHLLVFL